jgi:hypothetical protein
MPSIPPGQRSPWPTSMPSKRALDKRGLGRRYGGRHPRTMDRWKKAQKLPPPDAIINDIEFWYEETLDQFDRKSTIERAAANTPASMTEKEQDERQAP